MSINNNKADAKSTGKNVTCKKQEDMEKKMNFFFQVHGQKNYGYGNRFVDIFL